jgi:hypothetical protein
MWTRPLLLAILFLWLLAHVVTASASSFQFQGQEIDFGPLSNRGAPKVKTVLSWLNAVRDELGVETSESLVPAVERRINDENWLGLEQNQALVEALVCN